MTGDAAVRTEGLVKSYGGRTVLDRVDLAIGRGEVLALLGPNGAGKTTTVRILATLVPPDAGRASVAGWDVVRDAARVRTAISLTGQSAAVDEVLTAAENLLMMGRLRHLPAADARRRAAQLLDRLDLAADAHRRVKTYSGGMRRKTDLAMSLMGRPEVLFLDEPTTGLDPRSRQAVWDVVRGLVADGVTILLTTQYLEEADRLADRIAVLDGGRVLATGSGDELKRGVGDEQVELVLADAAEVPRAADLLGAVRADRAARTVRVATDGSAAHVREVLDRLARAGVEVATLSLHRPTLDDVFLALTGAGSTAASTAGSTAAGTAGREPAGVAR
jgi:ABC-2 type transport system ATP-binding protein